VYNVCNDVLEFEVGETHFNACYWNILNKREHQKTTNDSLTRSKGQRALKLVSSDVTDAIRLTCHASIVTPGPFPSPPTSNPLHWFKLYPSNGNPEHREVAVCKKESHVSAVNGEDDNRRWSIGRLVLRCCRTRPTVTTGWQAQCSESE
jgi:hypothetical protein